MYVFSLSAPWILRHRRHVSDGKAKKRKGKGKGKAEYLPDDLLSQWERDRAKKAENKRLRKEARMLAALDPFSPKSGGKKSHKLMLAALKRQQQQGGGGGEGDPCTPSVDVDMEAVEVQLRQFATTPSERQSMVLPPMHKAARKTVHELATAFGLKSVSKGHGVARYVTLMKKARMGIAREGQVRAILRREQKRGTPRSFLREGEEVGKASVLQVFGAQPLMVVFWQEAPMIGESNVGFRMLASMGWSGGAKIGGDSSVGIQAPLTAIIKRSKLGLGATRSASPDRSGYR